MTMIIEVQSREWDTVNITRALEIPAERNYVARLTVDDANAQVVFDQDVQLLRLTGDELTVGEWDEDAGQHTGVRHTFNAADIRRIELY